MANARERTMGADVGRTRRPNIVFLLADQWRGSALGYAGDPNVRTPNLDALARRSVEFRNAVSVCPVCTPYRAALMTGRYPTSTGMFLNDLCLPASELCMAEILRGAGYRTAYIGKWHLDGHGRTAFVPPERRQGWEYWKGAECDHSYLRSHYYEGDSPVKRHWEGYDAFAQTLDARAYIREHAPDARPFALFVSYGTPHFPHDQLPPGYKELYPASGIRLPPNVPPEMQERARREASGYYAHCEALDRCVGDVVATLDKEGLLDRTVVVFTSDHGEMLGSHGCAPFMKQAPWSEAACVPLLIRSPGAVARTVATPIGTPDLLPTLLGLAGVRVPHSIEGEDLSGLVRGGSERPGRAALYMSVSPFHGDRRLDHEYRAIRTSTHTYVRSLTGPWMLYDDLADPHQMRNLIGVPAYDQVRSDLDARLQSELRRIGDDFRPRCHYIKRFGYEIAPHGSISYAEGARPQSPRPSERL
jgi:arylsulfatase A-like enzyme